VLLTCRRLPTRPSTPYALHWLVAYAQGAYCLTLEFDGKLELQQWQDRLPKVQSFFGPGGVAVWRRQA
jgi:hypothetical protein